MVLAVICAHPTSSNSEFIEALTAMHVDYDKTAIFVSHGPSCDLHLDESFKMRFAGVQEHREPSNGTDAYQRAFLLLRQVKASQVLILENSFVVQQHDPIQQLTQDNLPAVVPLARQSSAGGANFGFDKGSHHEEDRDKLVSGERQGLWPNVSVLDSLFLGS
ncbi:unnamed protein product [Vitrella brassicaformis CCMP3155]|uniref:Uncharacterized protein n=1 Tax=Vitrella brassicaformis (strain CCMP3155) TaxID=1169540 RepID=A0A0G4GAH3_VITBC|nr:unnamed protein product [Vitrella brassicaformis CCMP3155]|mmetsp:Transcript_14863/g.35437  ORF Transcript_14863/g.35437 Transcript_14863/m.35437 type:complete len:162 (-) Transcript_14863:451-936(-)|eukprot:CEM25962.1 unnamed protein product [Vitrella brassicaformis CCMP3155]